jgi:hypothetical protein
MAGSSSLHPNAGAGGSGGGSLGRPRATGTVPQPPAVEEPQEHTFYHALAPFTDFAEVADPARYVAAPDDWILVMADIRGSTEAAQAGRYKDVNLVGAACITATLNVTKGLDLPYVFGGDGATILIPPAAREAVAKALVRTRRLAADGFGLELRVGMVPLQTLERAGFELADDDGDPPDLSGLSCRWEPHRSLRGRMLTFLLRTRDSESLALYREIIARLGAILGQASGSTSPVQRANMRFTWPPKGLRAEAILTHGRTPRWLRRTYLTLETFLQLIAERLDLKIGTYNPPAYREELRRNSDHRKAADTLQMVLDCTPAEIAAIEAYLADLHAAGRIVYGTHLADGAMMTCLVFSLEQSRHVHFIDGADGGYALAAVQLKAQLKALAEAASAAAAAPPDPPRAGRRVR